MVKGIGLFIVIIFSCVSEVFCQNYDGYYAHDMYSMLPDARQEAMGRGQVTMYEDVFSTFNNPAAGSFSRGLNAEFSHLDRNDPFRKSVFLNFYGAAYNAGEYGSFGFNMLHFDYGDMEKRYVNSGDEDWVEARRLNRTYLFMLNYSRQIWNDLSVGVNVNYFNDTYPKGLLYNQGYDRYSVFMADAGILKRFTIRGTRDIHNFYLGLSFTNIFNPSVEFTYDYGIDGKYIEQNVLPSAMQAGISYEYESIGRKVSGLSVWKTLLCAEYKDMLNSRYFSSIQLGAELTILEMLQLRCGYYLNQMFMKKFDPDMFGDFTYGAGLSIPVDKFYKLDYPFEIKFSYANIPYPLTFIISGLNGMEGLIPVNDYKKNYSVFTINIKAGI